MGSKKKNSSKKTHSTFYIPETCVKDVVAEIERKTNLSFPISTSDRVFHQAIIEENVLKLESRLPVANTDAYYRCVNAVNLNCCGYVCREGEMLVVTTPGVFMDRLEEEQVKAQVEVHNETLGELLRLLP